MFSAISIDHVKMSQARCPGLDIPGYRIRCLLMIVSPRSAESVCLADVADKRLKYSSQ